jgi:hypothetical protein
MQEFKWCMRLPEKKGGGGLLISVLPPALCTLCHFRNSCHLYTCGRFVRFPHFFHFLHLGQICSLGTQPRGKRQGIDLVFGADNRMGIQSRTNDDQDRERLTKVPKGGMHNWQHYK